MLSLLCFATGLLMEGGGKEFPGNGRPLVKVWWLAEPLMPEKVDSTTEQALEPPGPPEIQRRVQFYRLQAIGLPILLAVPIAAMFGIFDSANASTASSSNGARLTVSYPSRIRYESDRPLEIQVTNETGGVLQDAEVEVAKSYLDDFDHADFSPEPDHATADAYVFELGDFKPGESRLIAGRLEFDYLRGGRKPCSVRVKRGDQVLASVNFETFLLP